MNRPGQQPQRPPNLGPAPNIGGFRGPYQQAYGIPPRGVMPGYAAMQNHRATQGIVPQPTPGGFMQRTVGNANAFNFGGSMQQQQAVAQQQSQQQSSQQHHPQPPSVVQPPHPSAPPQNPPGAGTPGVPLHLALQQQQQQQGANASSTATAGSEVSLDLNDFPALGSGNTPNVAQATANLQSSYATQAAPSSNTVAIGAGSGQIARDFGPDDFPALGGQTQGNQQQGTPQSQESSAAQVQHPPGLNNGFQQSDQAGAQALRQNLLASALSQHGQRGLHSSYDVDKRSNFGKMNQNWSALGLPTSDAFSQNSNLTNGAQHILQQSASVVGAATAAGQPLSGPPGVPPHSSYSQQRQVQQQSQQQAASTQSYSDPVHGPRALPNSSNPSTNPASSVSNQSQVQPHPQTPAQQLVMSAADRWGLLGLLALIKNADPDTALLSFGSDVATVGLNVGQTGSISQSLVTPWSDTVAMATVEPDFHLPACYNVQPPPPGPTKAASFSDETLFFMFYSSPRDALQEVAAQELWNRNWRWHKELRHWLTKETGTPPSQKIAGGEVGTYTFWDPESWSKERKDMTVLYADLEEKAVPTFAPGPGLQTTLGAGTAPTTTPMGVGANAGIVGIGGMRTGQAYGGMGVGVVAGIA